LGYVRRWKRDRGRARVLVAGIPAGPRWGGVPRWLLAAYLRARLQEAGHRLRGRTGPWLRSYMDAQVYHGMIQQCRATVAPAPGPGRDEPADRVVPAGGEPFPARSVPGPRTRLTPPRG